MLTVRYLIDHGGLTRRVLGSGAALLYSFKAAFATTDRDIYIIVYIISVRVCVCLFAFFRLPLYLLPLLTTWTFV